MKVQRVEPNKVIKNSFRCLINNPFKKLRIGERYSNQQAHERTGEKTVHVKTTGTPVKDVALVCVWIRRISCAVASTATQN